MKLIKLALLAGLIAAPAFAQTPAPANDTIQAMVAKGFVLNVMGMAYGMTPKADGTYADDQGSGGKWRADGPKMCITPDAIGQEICIDYPAGKKSGDKFEVQSDFGPMEVVIK